MREENVFSSDIEKNEALNRILASYEAAREKINFPTNKRVFDEDVNVYIAHLLFAFAMPNYSYIVEQYISMQPHDVRMLIDMAEDEYFKYFIYKVNGDNLLLHLGLFNDIGLYEKPKKVEELGEHVEYRELALHYYQQAAASNRKIHKRKTALSEVLLKVVKYFDQYAKALQYVKKDYFHFYDVFEDEEFSQFIGDFSEYERKQKFEEKQDEFLVLYSQWMKTKAGRLRTKINKVCKELRSLDSTFSFKIE